MNDRIDKYEQAERMVREPSCRGCDTDDLALKYCAGCSGVFCDSCINYLHAPNDYDNGDWFCKKCAEGMKEIE